MTGATLNRDFGVVGKSVRLYEAFIAQREVDEQRLNEAGISFQEAQRSEDSELRESGSTSDFATYLNDKVTKRLMWAYGEVSSSWRTWARTYSVPDFKPISFVRLGEFQGLLEVNEGGEYKDSKRDEIVGPSLTVSKFGRLFSLTMETIINDDLNQLRDVPAGFGRAAARTLQSAISSKLEDPATTTYDGVALFHASHNNLMSLALTEDALAQAIVKIRTQTSPDGNRIGLRPRFLLVPANLELTARRILNSTAVPQPSEGTAADLHATTQHGRGGVNVLQGIVDLVVDEYLTDTNDWYVFADPNEAPTIGVGFLNGRENPEIFLKDPGMRNVLGGSDPYSMEFDEIVWKIRHFYGLAAMDWRGAVKSSL